MDGTSDTPEGDNGHNRFKLNRRSFLVWLGAFATSATASYLAGLVPRPRLQDGSRGSDQQIEETLRTLLGTSDRLKFHNGGIHYLVKGIHSDNAIVGRETIEALSAVVPTVENGDVSLFELDSPSDWVLIGAPSSNLIARDVLGFAQENLIRGDNDPHLRFVYEYEDTLVDLRRYTASRKLQAQAIRASVRDLKTNNVYRPDEGGWLEEDYLLITRTIVRVSGVDRFRTVIGGTHGVGTRGFNLMLYEDYFSKRDKQNLIGRSRGTYQILAKVNAKSTATQTVPTGIKILEVHVA